MFRADGYQMANKLPYQMCLRSLHIMPTMPPSSTVTTQILRVVLRLEPQHSRLQFKGTDWYNNALLQNWRTRTTMEDLLVGIRLMCHRGAP